MAKKSRKSSSIGSRESSSRAERRAPRGGFASRQRGEVTGWSAAAGQLRVTTQLATVILEAAFHALNAVCLRMRE
jgi:hypothetical protein